MLAWSSLFEKVKTFFFKKFCWQLFPWSTSLGSEFYLDLKNYFVKKIGLVWSIFFNFVTFDRKLTFVHHSHESHAQRPISHLVFAIFCNSWSSHKYEVMIIAIRFARKAIVGTIFFERLQKRGNSGHHEWKWHLHMTHVPTVVKTSFFKLNVTQLAQLDHEGQYLF